MNRRRERYWMGGFLAFLAAVIWQGVQPLLACPACKDAVEQAANGGQVVVDSSPSPFGPNNLAKGFFWSVLTMLGVVYALVGTGVFFILRAVRKARPGAQPNEVASEL